MPKFSIYSILKYYAMGLTAIMVIGGFASARSSGEVLANFLFLPVAVFVFWVWRRDFQEKSPADQTSFQQRPTILKK